MKVKPKKEPSLHTFLTDLYGTESCEKSLMKLRDIFVGLDIAKPEIQNMIAFKVQDDNLDLNFKPDNRSRRFINSEDETLGSKRTPNVLIRELLYSKFCENDFAIIKRISEQFSDAGLSSISVNEIAEAVFANCFENMEDNKTVFRYIRNLDDNAAKLAWIFVFLCFPRVPSGSHSNFRSLILNAMRHSSAIDIIPQPYNVTDNDDLIGKVSAVDIGRDKEIIEIKAKMLANNTVFLHGIRGIGTTFIARKLFWDYYNNYSDGIEYLAWIHYSNDLVHSLDHAFSISIMDTSAAGNDLFNHTAKDFSTKKGTIEQCISIADIFKDIRDECYTDLLLTIADGFENLADSDNEIKYYTRIIELLGDDIYRKSCAYSNLAIAYRNNEQHEESLKSTLQALTLYSRQLEINTDEAMAVNERISLLVKQGKNEEAINEYISLLTDKSFVSNVTTATDTDEKTEAFSMILKNCINIGTMYSERGKFELSANIISSILKTLDNFTNIEISDIGMAYNTLAYDYSNMGDPHEAFNTFLRALRTCKEDTISSAIICANLGEISLGMGDPVRSLNFNNKALLIFEKNYGADDYRVAELLFDIAKVYFFQRDFDSSLNCFKRVRDSFSKYYGERHENTIEVKKIIEIILAKRPS